jgi:TetR/AcrR family transcriptional regulator, tetracycline repressor protein
VTNRPDGPTPGEGHHWLDPAAPDPPARLPLTRRRIVEEALALVDEEGLRALTVRRLGARLGVAAMSLYSHVSDKAELVDLMVDHVLSDALEGLDENPGEDWAEQLRTIARRYHDAWAAHPDLVNVYSDGVILGPNAIAVIERLLAVLRGAGFTDEHAAASLYTLWHHTIGSLQVAPVRPTADGPTRGPDGRLIRYFSITRPESIPNIVAVAPHLSGGSIDYDLDTLIIGLRVRLAAGA